MQFRESGLQIESIVNIIVYQEDFKSFILDIQNSYRIERAMGKDPDDELLHKTYAIDDIIKLMEKLEPARAEYYSKLKEETEAQT